MLKKQTAERQDERKQWLHILQSKFNLDEKVTKELDKKLRACFALKYDITKVKKVIRAFLEEHNHRVTEEDIDVVCVFTSNAGSRRYRRWAWQENLFCIMAYLLSLFFFIIDLIDFDGHGLLQVVCQVGVVVLVTVVWGMIDRIWRGNTKWDKFFSASNTIMPGTTAVAYLFFYVAKLMFVAKQDSLWHGVMILIVALYFFAGIIGTLCRYKYYLKIEKSLMEKIIGE